jgi:hypothetical protein
MHHPTNDRSWPKIASHPSYLSVYIGETDPSVASGLARLHALVVCSLDVISVHKCNRTKGPGKRCNVMVMSGFGYA